MMVCIAAFLAGIFHVFSGPDHLAALAPLSLGTTRKRSWALGLRWGGGHAAGVLLVGVASLLLRGWLRLDFISSVGERLVGVFLIGLGIWGLRRAFSRRIHVHQHCHGEERHIHIHMHSAHEPHEHMEAHAHGHAAFGVGTIHGIAGSSHLFGVLPSLALPGWRWSVVYLLMFGLGTVVAMGLFSRVMGFVTSAAGVGVTGYRRLLAGVSGASIVVGGWWAIAG